MVRKLKVWLFLALPLFGLYNCNLISSDSKGQIVAECYGKALYTSDLEGLVSPGTPKNDSLDITRLFIENWVKQQVMLKQAESNLSDDQKNFKALLESYRNSLIIYEFESELIKQKLDTIVNEKQIEDFYNQNQGNFLLSEDIIKVIYLKIPIDAVEPAYIKKVKGLLQSQSEKSKDALIESCQNSAVICNLDDEKWIRFNDLAMEIPFGDNDQDDILNPRKLYETSDSLFTYLVYFKEVKTKGSTSPLSYETDNIRNLILNRRKVELVDRMQQEVFQEALKNKEFTIY